MTKYVILFVTLLAGSLSIPIPEQDEDLSMFFTDSLSETRIVGGTAAEAGSDPHMVALTNGLLIRSFICGGSIITQRSVLTAAHCVVSVFSSGVLSSTFRITVGTNRWNLGGQTYHVAHNVTHPYYEMTAVKNDISLLITSTDLVLSQLVSPISLTFDVIPGGVPARIAGWGRIRTNGANSAVLLELAVNTISGEECVEVMESAASTMTMSMPQVEPNIEVCTYHSPEHGTCNGDSGSALTRVSDGRQIGLASWAYPCANGVPDVFVRISSYQDWLHQNLV